MRGAAPSVDGRTLFIGIGAQKSGTSWLYTNLHGHPEVLMAQPKERHWFDDPSSREGAGDYLEHFRARLGSERVFGEITPAYATLSRSEFRQMLCIHSDVRFLFSMRDPVARVWSQLRMQASTKGVPAISLLDRLDMPGVVQRTRYDRTITEVEAAIQDAGRDVASVFMTIFFEDLVRAGALSEVFRFLGIMNLPPPHPEPVFVGVPETLPVEAARHIRELYAPVYDFVRRRFGAAAPSSWAW